MTDLDRFTETELEAMHLDTYQRALSHFEEVDRLLSVLAGLPYPSAAYRAAQAAEQAAKVAGTEAYELLRAIGRQLDSLRAARIERISSHG